MRLTFILTPLLLLNFNLLQAQNWGLLPNSPTATWRHDDLFFVNADTGWVVNVDGYIYKTSDGGLTWTTQLNQPATSFRCVGFANKNKGWVGNLGTGAWSPTTDTLPLYQTFDGGSSWTAVTNISGPRAKGICGISVVDSLVVYAVGRVGGPPFIMKTTDGGTSWTSTAAPSHMFNLIDCKFFSADTGLIAGCTGTLGTERFAVFYTNDGGQNWQTVHNSTNMRGVCWKFSFPSRNTGYASVEAWPAASIPVLKTTDGGLTWTEKVFDIPYHWNQGIGFINDSVGWCGANPGKVKQTINGADTWSSVPFVSNFNRFRKVNDTVAYASGQRIWKYSKEMPNPTDIKRNDGVPDNLILGQNFPNPFSDKTKIKYHLPKSGRAIIKVYDWAGRPVKTLVDELQPEGDYEVDLSLPYYYDVHFYYSLSFDGAFLTQKAIMLKK